MIKYGKIQIEVLKNEGYPHKRVETRTVKCSECGSLLDEQQRDSDNNTFEYNNYIMEDYEYCPYCGKKL